MYLFQDLFHRHIYICIYFVCNSIPYIWTTLLSKKKEDDTGIVLLHKKEKRKTVHLAFILQFKNQGITTILFYKVSYLFSINHKPPCSQCFVIYE